MSVPEDAQDMSKEKQLLPARPFGSEIRVVVIQIRSSHKSKVYTFKALFRAHLFGDRHCASFSVIASRIIKKLAADMLLEDPPDSGGHYESDELSFDP